MNEHLATTIELSTASTTIIKLITSCTIENSIFHDSLFFENFEGVLIETN